jgi:hypothetical protein
MGYKPTDNSSVNKVIPAATRSGLMKACQEAIDTIMRPETGYLLSGDGDILIIMLKRPRSGP